jgi:hypothetical protein
MADIPQLVTGLSVDLSQIDGQLKAGLAKQEDYAKNSEGVHKDSLSRIEKMYARVQLQNKLTVANVSGNQKQIQALQDELELTRQIALARRAGMNVANATKAAQDHMAAVRAAREEAEEASKASHGSGLGGFNRAQTMELTHVAKSLFDQISAGASPMRALSVEGGRLAQVFAEGEGGVGGSFKSLLGLMTPLNLGLGLIAAGAVAGVVALGKVKEAAQEITTLKINADKLGIPIEDLQQWQFVAAQSHVSNDDLDRSFDGLSVTLGKLKSGIREQRIQPFIEELGITDGDIAKARNAGDLMNLLITKMAAIRDPAERIQIADAFGMQSAMPLLSKTREEIQGMTDDFRRNASVVSGAQADSIERNNQKMEGMHAIMHDKIRADLVELAPMVQGLWIAWDTVAEKTLGAIAVMANGLGRFEQTAEAMANYQPKKPGDLGSEAGAVGANALGRFNTAITHPTTSILDLLGVGGPEARWWNIGKPRDILPQMSGGEGKAHAPSGEVGAGERTRAAAEGAKKATEDFTSAIDEYVTHTSHAEAMQKRINDDRKNGAVISPEQASSLMAAARSQDAKFGESEARKAAAASRKAIEENKASDDAISEAKKAELKAHIAITADLAAEHVLKLEELGEERDKKNRQATQDAAAGKISSTAAQSVIGSNNRAYDDSAALEARQYEEEVANQARTYAEDLIKFQIKHLSAQAQIATTADEWAAETKAAFAAQQKIDRDDFAAKTAARTHEIGANHLDAGQAQAEVAAYDAAQAEEMSKNSRDVDLQVLDRKKAFADQLTGYTTSMLSAEASMATTVQQRQAIELQLLQIKQQEARDALEDQIRKDHVSPDQAAALRGGLQASQTAEFTSKQVQDQRADNPLYSYANPTEGVGQQLQTEQVKAMQEFGDDVASAITQTKNLGEAFHATAQSIVADLLKIAIQRSITQPLANALFGAEGGGASAPPLGSSSGNSGWYGLGTSSAPLDSALDRNGMDPSGSGDLSTIGQGISLAGTIGKLFGLPAFRDGTDDAPGGLTEVGEDGPELVNLPGGAKVSTNTELNALNAASASQASTNTTMNHNISIDLTGANGDETIRQIAGAAAHQGTMLAIAASRSDLKKAQRAPQRNLMSY